jgi:Co/Zn/Cd efflux system component|tara:strand:- start:622 stop:1446 length:825 start_codon:yes stop_codon:yes gene_type:complete
MSDSTTGWRISDFSVPRMDCPSEEGMIRMALDGVAGVQGLAFDLSERQVQVLHDQDVNEVMSKLGSLGLGAQLVGTRVASADEAQALYPDSQADVRESRTLKILLAINGFMFFAEFMLGWLAQSAGLLADSLDMFADAAVYGVALYAVGRSLQLKTRAAHLAGWLQLLMALGVLAEVGRRLLFGSQPVSALMIAVGAAALTANVACLFLIYRHRHGGSHMKASWIFSANDVIANVGLILAAVLVAWTGSRYPDLIIGTIVGFVVLAGARRILKL